MKTKFNPTEITLIKHWAKDSNLKPDYVTIYRYPKMGEYNYRILISDENTNILAWEIPWTEESGRLQSMGLQKSWTQLSD